MVKKMQYLFLRKMTGVQYQVVSANAPLFVIRKHQRNSSTDGLFLLNL